MKDRQRELAQLLLSLFDDAELRRELRAVGGDSFAQSLPTPPIPAVTLAAESVRALVSWGLVGPELWQHLVQCRGRRRRDIDAVSRVWGDTGGEDVVWLAFGELCQLANLMLGSPLRDHRDALFARIPRAVQDAIPIGIDADAQMLNDLDSLNRTPAGESASYLERWIENARALSGADAQRAAGLDYFLACVTSRSPIASGLVWEVIGRSDNQFRRGWPRFARPLRYTLAVASSIVRNEVHKGSQDAATVVLPTKFFFAAVRLLEPAPTRAVLQHIPAEALGEPLLPSLRLDAEFLMATPQPSGCLAAAIRRLLGRVPVDRELTVGDLFLDVAKYGTGESVELLRRHKILPDKLDQIAAKIGFKPISTPGPHAKDSVSHALPVPRER